MADRRELHDLRKRGHKAGIEGSSKMRESELRDALKRVDKGAEPMTAKQQAKRGR